MQSYKTGDEAWILESGRYPRPVRIQKINGAMCIIRFTDRMNISGTMIRMNRLYATKEEAQANAAPKPEEKNCVRATENDYRGKHYYED